MLFSKLIRFLEQGESSVKDYSLLTDPEITSAASLEKAETNQISFLEDGSYLLNELDKTNASALIIPDQKSLIQKATDKNISWVAVKDPRIAFAETLALISTKSIKRKGIHSSAIIHKSVQIGNNIYIGANVCIEEGSKIGRDTDIHPGVVIYNNVEIGEGSILHSNCVIHPFTKLGANCVINSNAVIGSEGFGFIPTNRGWKKMPQTGNVILEDNVEIGSGSTIDRPVVGETRISSGTKIDNLVQIGHGVNIGRNCAMAAQVGIAGGAKIQDNVILAGQVGVANRVTVGKNVIASSKCGIHTDIEPDQIISGFPAISNKLWLKSSAIFKKLPEIAKVIRKLDIKA
ncbi:MULTISPECIES: UDP-3-O-(3-hydroxymyristoyl)glucosamine N-acyltransferase [unclassified Prochlorococcus]|uniref:UDP-3-O-(3-hydroxymyristoyl)glucosamine N-acyltransferase n=1 Tax=unclassified Prochlorococcus TaxID=2627481 RepID=UPI0005336F8A|nr:MULTISPECIES: UDP-3-O-(3-hydroxymyristoyl)glucosamine N-acyltransferase [unclassified Prochlorococcus]KGG15180.1 UDP-3-O-(3-hydroxymyristoyl) glucosamine N-acyltransferase [Prochlorococcus sp. MIT 0602]KGG17454.1 UDP-3-O-(3-hydroxymyristoyl) glucosamine N-acyltransferase [Prochlorococcus sp. MIT 0603]